MRRWLTAIFTRKPATVEHVEGWHFGNPDAKHPYALQADHPLADIASGMCFYATLQLRTPLRILQRNGQILPLGTDLPEDFEQWMGIWLPKTRTYAEIFDHVAQPDFERSVASPIGPVKPSEYLPFLMTIREVVEDRALSLDDRQTAIAVLCSRPEFKELADRHGGVNEIFSYFHPPVLSLIPGLTEPVRDGLRALGLITITGIRQTTDSELSSVKGLGPSKIAGIRAFCDSYRSDPDVEYRTEIE